MERYQYVLFVLLVVAVHSIVAFTTIHRPSISVCQGRTTTLVNPFGLNYESRVGLYMSEEPQQGQQGEVSAEEEVTAEDGSKGGDVVAEGEEAKEEKEPEDPEVTALKEKIAELEGILKSKRGTLDYTKEAADDYSKTGYFRKVAEMENMKRMRSGVNQSNKFAAEASILKEFLPSYDSLRELKTKYVEDEFGSKYGGMTMDTLFSSMGVVEFVVEAGSPVDATRMEVVHTEHSEEVGKDTVLGTVSPGLELQGHVVRHAQVAASLGSEQAKEPAEEAAPPAEEGAPTSEGE